MALWRFDGHRFERVPIARADACADVYLCCPGPSLRRLDPAVLQSPGAIAVAINTAFPHVRHPDYWIGTDLPTCYDRSLPWQPFLKLWRAGYQWEPVGGTLLRDTPSSWFVDLDRAPAVAMFRRRGPDVRLIWNRCTFVAALHWAVIIGARTIHLVGCDLGGADYHDGRELRPELSRSNHILLDKLVGLLPALRVAAEAAGLRLVSCTEGSRANQHLDYIPLTDALARSAARVPAILGEERLHCRDAYHIRWIQRPLGARAVVTGADAQQEWLLPWWYDHLRRREPDLPVCWADFGLSDQARAWCRERGTMISLRHAPGRLPWHRKPMAITAVPYTEIAWLDADCEVRAPLTDLWSSLGPDGGIGLTLDPYSPFARQPGALATGVVVCRHSEPAIVEWGREILSHEHRGDQEALNAIRARLAPRIRVLDSQWQALRLGGPARAGDRIYHWTGEVGKRAVRAQIEAAVRGSRPAAGATEERRPCAACV